MSLYHPWEQEAMPRALFREHIEVLAEKVVSMGSRVEKAVAQAMEALTNHNGDLAQDVINGDLQINHMQRSITEQALILIATQQPMASDLRMIFAMSNIASDLERMGDHAEGIGKIALKMLNEPSLPSTGDLNHMADLVRLMLREQLAAFVLRSVVQARTVCQRDEEIDQLYRQFYNRLMRLMVDDPQTIRRANYLLWVAHNLERIADRTTNIGEQIVYLVTGQVEELNPKRVE